MAEPEAMRINPERLHLIYAYIRNKSGCIAACALEGHGLAFVGKLSMVVYNLSRDLEQKVDMAEGRDDLCAFCEKEAGCSGKCRGPTLPYAVRMDAKAGDSYSASDLLGRIRRAE